MALVLRRLYRGLSVVNEEFYKDPRVTNYPLVGSPVPALIVIALYVLFVKKWGPNWMNNRKPFNIKFLIQIYNFLQIVLSGYLFAVGSWNSYLQKDFSLTCQPVQYHNTSEANMRLLRASYVYYVTKYLDLFDTVFFILRKKNSHITFLHVYHHSIMVLSVWLFITCIFAGHATMLGVVNTFVHTVMYIYYFASSLNLKIDLGPWKKIVTQLQILQFCCLVVHFSFPLLNNWCKTRFSIIYAIAVIQNIFMAVMFLDFYYKAYVKKRPNKQKLA